MEEEDTAETSMGLELERTPQPLPLGLSLVDRFKLGHVGLFGSGSGSGSRSRQPLSKEMGFRGPKPTLRSSPTRRRIQRPKPDDDYFLVTKTVVNLAENIRGFIK